MPETYRIKKWNELYETSETRKLKHLQWVPVPNKHDGKGFRRLLRSQEGPLLFAAWVLVLQIASKCPNRGILADDDGPLTPADLSDKTGLAERVFEKALKRLCEKDIGWIQADGSAGLPAEYPALPESSPVGMEGKGREGNELLGHFDTFWKAYPKKKAKADALKAWKALKPDFVLVQVILGSLRAQAASRDWAKDNGKFIPHPATWLRGRRWEDEDGNNHRGESILEQNERTRLAGGSAISEG